MIAEIKILIETDRSPAWINARLPKVILSGLPAAEIVVRVTGVEMSWADWAEKMIDREAERQQAGTGSGAAEITELDEEVTA